MSIEADWDRCRSRVNAYLDELLPPADAPPVLLHRAMRYSAIGGGKRIRGILVYLTGEMLGADIRSLDAPAAALELIHAYSLVHDDLPSMDDDDMRRGKPSCHVAYDEATAILVGDALQAMAFHALTAETNSVIAPHLRVQMVAALSKAAGSAGMVGGQVMDLAINNQNGADYDFDKMHSLKTAALFVASVHLGALASGRAGEDVIDALRQYGENIGLAFQCVDDALDGENFARSTKSRAALLHDQAVSALDQLDGNTSSLRKVAKFIIDRRTQ